MLQCAWTVRRAHLHYLGALSGPTQNIYFTVVSTRSIAPDLSTLVQNGNDDSLQVRLQVLVDPCDPDPCRHNGICSVLDRQDVIVAQCTCRYPWAGAYCDTLAMSREVYTWEMLLLVLSNSVMIPAVLESVSQTHYQIATCLSASALFSAVYHLCDTDTVCLFTLSFEALHVLDVLFSVVSIASLLLFYAPITREQHASGSLFLLALLLGPIIVDPTNAIVLVIAVVGSIAVTVVLWCYHFRRSTPSSLQIETINDSVNRSSLYTTVPQSDLSLQPGDIELSSNFGNGDDNAQISEDREVLSNPLHLARQSLDPRSSGDASRSNSTTSTTTLNQSSSLRARVIEVLSHGREGVAGGVVGLVGLSCYALDSRTNYWFVHSIWHVAMMVAAYLLLRGRHALFLHFGIDFDRRERKECGDCATN